MNQIGRLLSILIIILVILNVTWIILGYKNNTNVNDNLYYITDIAEDGSMVTYTYTFDGFYIYTINNTDIDPNKLNIYIEMPIK